jgi:hypothetical protein
MSRSWNGQDLVDELSALLGDTSSTFQAKVLGWLNDTIFDVSTRHEWPFHLVKGKKKLTSGQETHSLDVAAPGAPTVAAAAGGSLTADTAYKVLVTFVQDNGVESIAGTASALVTPSGANLTISVSAIPVSTESLVTKRNVYLKKGSGAYYYYSTINDNSTTTLNITTDTSSTIEPPDYASFRRLKGNPFFESAPSCYLSYKDIDQLRLLVQGSWSSGDPEYFSVINFSSVTLYPIPNSTLDLSFNYYRNPFRLYDSEDSQPDLPIYLKPVLKAGVIALGYEYRDRDGQERKRQSYEALLSDAISRYGRVGNLSYAVRDVYGNHDGYEV